MNELEQYQESILAEIAPLEAVSLGLLESANAVAITDDKTLVEANDIKKRVNAHTKTVKDLRLQLTRPIDALKDVLMRREREVLTDAEKAKAVLSDKILGYEAELERQRQIERERVEAIAQRVNELYTPGMTRSQVEHGREKAKALMAEIPEADKAVSAVKLAFLTLSNSFTQRLQDIEVEEQRQAKKKLEDDEARIAREKADLEARAERARLEEARLEAAKAEARAERDRPKSNIVELTEFEIVDADSVPRALCSPDPTKIRMAIKAGATEIEGVRIFTTKRVR